TCETRVGAAQARAPASVRESAPTDMDGETVGLNLDHHVGEMLEDGHAQLKPPSEDLGAVRLLAAQTEVSTNGVALAAFRELTIVGDQHCSVLSRIHRLIVVRVRPRDRPVTPSTPDAPPPRALADSERRRRCRGRTAPTLRPRSGLLQGRR